MPQALPTRYERRSSIASSTASQASQSPPPRTTSLPGSSPSRPSTLMSRLNRLSNSTSRPNLPSPPPQQPQQQQEDTYTSRAANAMRSVSQSGKDVLRRTGFGAWAGSSANSSLVVTEQDEQDEDDLKPPLPPKWPVPQHLSPQPPHLSPRINASPSLDTSMILYATMSNHPPPLENLPVLVLNLAALAAVPTPVTNDVLLATVLRRLEPWVGDEGDAGYTLIVLAAEEDASSKGKRRALPGVTWWIWNWRRIPRKYRKNLKRLYIVHPGTAAKTLLPITLPLLSPKTYPKLHIVPSLLALSRAGIPLRGVDVPLSTLTEEARILRENPELAIPRTGVASFGLMNTLGQQGGVLGGLGWGVSAISSAIGTANSYLPFKLSAVALPPSPETESKRSLDQDGAEPAKYWSGGDLEAILEDNKGSLPRVLHELRALILGMCSDTEGIFRKTATSHLLPPLQGLLDLPPKAQPKIDWAGVAITDPYLPPILLMRLLKGLSSPLIPEDLYPLIRSTYTPDEIRTNLIPALSPASSLVLTHLTHIGHHLLAHEGQTRMSATNLAIVFAPSLISGQDPRVDAALCLEPGKSLPPSLMPPDWAESGGTQTLVGLLQLWISEWPAVAEFTVSKSGWCDCAWADAGGQLSASDPSTPIGMGRRSSGAKSGLYHELLGGQVMSSLAPATEAEYEAGVGAGLGYILNEDNNKNVFS